jgi:hypothetical protein
MLIKTINTFNDVVIEKENTLILCDIDNTLLYYTKKATDFYIEVQKSIPNKPTHFYINKATEYYYKYTAQSKPFHTDYDGFINMTNQLSTLNGNIMFVTARNKPYEDITKKHFSDIGLVYDDYVVHYTEDKISKGEYIKLFIDISNASDVIFIDDYDEYIQSVLDICPDIKCYKFDYKR